MAECGEEYNESAITCARPFGHDGDHCNVDREPPGPPMAISWPRTEAGTIRPPGDAEPLIRFEIADDLGGHWPLVTEDGGPILSDVTYRCTLDHANRRVVARPKVETR